MAGRYEAIVFDFDGVLVESIDIKTQAFASLYAAHGVDVVSKVVAYHLANGGVTRSNKFRYYHETLLGIPLTKDAEAKLARRFACLVEDAVVSAPTVPGALEFLERHAGTLRLFMASSTPEEELKRIVARRGMNRYFSGIYGAPATKCEIIKGIVERGHIDRRRVLMVGDALSDLHGAVRAGVQFLGRRSGSELQFPRGVDVINDLTELPHYVLRVPNA